MSIASTFSSIADTASRVTNADTGRAVVERAIRVAADKTGVDFSYLMEKAAVESNFRTDVKAKTSSATGLYQFIDSTWLNTVKEHGAKHGLGDMASAIRTDSKGRLSVADPAQRREILELRKDPRVASLMAAEFARDNKEQLEKSTGREVGPTELYMAHFLGAGGAAKFLNALEKSPNANGSDLLPEAAAANKGVFRDRETGKARSLQQIYDRFAAKFSDQPTSTTTMSATAAVMEEVRRSSPATGFATQISSFPTATMPVAALSIYQVLALNALETPDEVSSITGKAPNGEYERDDGKPRRMRDEPVRTDQTSDTGLGLGLGLARSLSPGAALNDGGAAITI